MDDIQVVIIFHRPDVQPLAPSRDSSASIGFVAKFLASTLHREAHHRISTAVVILIAIVHRSLLQ